MKFAHINLIANDWKKLSQFYIDVFGCEAVYPERNLSGEWIDKLTGIQNSEIKGIHLKLSGYEDGPTLEVFQYKPALQRKNDPLVNHQGFGHIAFMVEDIPEIISSILDKGGSKYGELVQKKVPQVGLLTAIYMKDIEGNIIELQNWE
jgi:catechol 2,3-dioxygenase-like lactoylglutathione lyase family enzyme